MAELELLDQIQLLVNTSMVNQLLDNNQHTVIRCRNIVQLVIDLTYIQPFNITCVTPSISETRHVFVLTYSSFC